MQEWTAEQVLDNLEALELLKKINIEQQNYDGNSISSHKPMIQSDEHAVNVQAIELMKQYHDEQAAKKEIEALEQFMADAVNKSGQLPERYESYSARMERARKHSTKVERDWKKRVEKRQAKTKLQKKARKLNRGKK